MRPPPAYQEYPSDLLANENYRLMSLEQRGLFHTLRHHCWVNDSIPASSGDLSILLALSPQDLERTFVPRVRAFFLPSEIDPGRLISPELRDYKIELMERSQKRTEAGKRGGQSSARGRARMQAKVDSFAQANPEVKQNEVELKSGEQGGGVDSDEGYGEWRDINF